MNAPTDHKELKKLTKEKAETYLSALLDEWMGDLRTDGEIEDKRKGVALLLDWVGWKEPPPKDPLANLPMANIVINLQPPGGGAPEPITLPLLNPTPQMLDCVDINADVVTDD